MSQLFQEILPPARQYQKLPQRERNIIRAVLTGYMRGSGVIHRSGFGVEGTLEALINLCNKGIVKINPVTDKKRQYEIYTYKNKWDGYVHIATVRIEIKA